ncbi:MAG: hypothetical protein NT157_02085 [Candidatus Micrarchaeota archaeon]|nr:hypothetical protein [Candidatus Micrarchaeota archaeon]
MELENAFVTTSRILFGKEIGRLAEFGDYLNGMVDQPSRAKSSISGNPVYLSRPYYDEGARFASLEELQNAKFGLNINEMKDINTLLEALGEKMHYCGSKNLGISMNVEQSDACNDGVDILSSYNVIASNRVAYSNGVRESENVFGCQLGGEIGFSMRSQVIFFSHRCFETYLSKSCNDMYFSFNCRGCTDGIFCFNQASKHCMIGNVQLPREKYFALKKKLLSEVAEELSRKKRFPSIFEIAEKGAV